MSLAQGNGKVDVSVLVPAKDEAENLPVFVEQRADALSDVLYSCDVVIVNDGSVDDTASILASLAESCASGGGTTSSSHAPGRQCTV